LHGVKPLYQVDRELSSSGVFCQPPAFKLHQSPIRGTRSLPRKADKWIF
jgi:hypothetical protein